MKLNDLIAQASRGEPVFVSAVIAALLGTLGAQVTDGQAQNIVTAMATIAAAVLARRHTTPQANPAEPTKRVDLENGQHQVDNRQPVITFRGRRPA